MKIRIPKSETIWVSYVDNNGTVRFVITSKELRDKYYLYEVEKDGTARKIRSGKTPELLDEMAGRAMKDEK